MRIAAIDQGTTSTRVLVCDSDGTAVIAHSLRHEPSYPQASWVEHNPLELLANIRACLSAAGEIDAIGIDNQGESCLAWDRITGEPLSPVIVWQDNRTAEAIARLKAAGAETLTIERAGLPLDAYFSAGKLAWILQNVPAAREVAKRGRLRLGTTDAFFLDRLTGTFATDVSTASRTSLMNIARQEWDEELCRLFGVPVECLPPIHATVDDFGGVGTAPVLASVVDQQAALHGHQCRAKGDAKVTFGTGAFALALTGEEIVCTPGKGLLSTIAWRIGGKTTFAVDGGVYDAGAAVEWVRRLGLFVDFSELDRFERPPAITRDLAFVPALSGLGCPHWDRSAAALWIGMTADASARDLCQALLEGIAFATAEVIDAMAFEVGLASTLSVDGGLTRSTYFLQCLADATGRRIVAREFDELTAFGCAQLAAIGLGESLPPRFGAERRVEPLSTAAGKWRERHRDAIARARGWRGSS